MKRIFTLKKTAWSVLQKPNLLTVFRLSSIFMLVICIQLNARAFSQKLSITVKNAPLEEVFKQIRQQTDFLFLYDNELIRKSTPVSLNLKNASLTEVLDKSFKNQPFSYSVIEKNIVIKPAVSSTINTSISENRAEIRGTVQDQNGESLIGASVKVKGTTVGVSTDVNGNFTINAEPNSILVVSYTGYETLEVPVNNRTTLNIRMVQDTRQLSEVVVTALGIAKERKALGYSVTEVKGEELTQAREINVGNSLVGKVAGLNVNSVSGGPGSSVNIQIRGMSSISQSNQPLYVVNGVPMSNETSSGRGQFQSAPDRGDNIGNINPDDIESISVLKGAAASALYGSRAKAGVILITTKSGKAGAPAVVEFNTNYVINQVVDVTNFQYEYGQGSIALVNGAVVMNKPINAAQAYSTGSSSWGPKMDGLPYIQADGVMRPYSASPNNIDKFYGDGGTWTNTLSFTKGFDQGSVRFSGSNLANTNIVPNSGLDRQTFNLAAAYNITKRLSVDVRANYILENGKNRARLGDNSGNAAYGLFSLANTINIEDFKNPVDANGNEINISGSAFTTNPWFAAKFFKHNTKRNRLISSGTLKYAFDNGAFIQARAARDYYTDRYTLVVPTGTAYRVVGELQEQQASNFEINADILAGKMFKVNEDLSITPNVGASYRNISAENFNTGGTGFSVPYVYFLGNVPTRTVSYGAREEEMQAVYGTLEMNYKDLFYLTGTGRTDWFSTLATPDNSNPVNKFYPSVSGSFVFSELLSGKLSWLSFGKLRAGYAEVGQATSPYQTALTYGFSAVTLNGFPIGNISGGTVPNKELKPSEASELEIGTEIRLFNNRVSMDLTWYKKNSTNEIVNAPASQTSGYTAAALNIGKLQNTGFEGLIAFTPFQKKDGFNWTTSINGTINNNKIIALAPGDAPLTWATARSNTAFIQHRVGEPASQVVAYEYLRDAAGNIQNNPLTGHPLPSTVLTSQGSAYHKWLAGWMNEFSFKKFNFCRVSIISFLSKMMIFTASFSKGSTKQSPR